MLVTINTDASFSSEFNIGSYAFWIACDIDTLKFSGAFKDTVLNPSQSEFKCIINSLYCLKKYIFHSNNISKIIINTDSMNSIHVIEDNKAMIKKYNLHKWSKGLDKKFRQITSELGLTKSQIECRHVRSHISTDTKRTWVNQWCDDQAKYHLRIKINELRQFYENAR